MTFTRAELECVISVVEMVLDGSGCTFADWGETNPGSLPVLEAADSKLRQLELRAIWAKGDLPDVTGTLMVSLQLKGED